MSISNQTRCFICGASAEFFEVDGDSAGYMCDSCGTYSATNSLMNTKGEKYERDQIVSLRGWIHTRNQDGETPQLSTNNIDKIIQQPTPNVSRRLEQLLIELKKQQKYVGSTIQKGRGYFIGVSYSANKTELFELIDNLKGKGYVVKDEGSSVGCRVTTEGFLAVEGFLNKYQQNSKQAFVAMWFGKELVKAYEEGIEPAISSAGYNPFRVDQHDHINNIDDEIIAQIRRSKFLVADMTGQRGGVYFEAGFAYGLGIPVIYTCNDDDFKNIHFDIRQINCIVWKTHDELRTKLENRIKAVIV